MDSLPKPFPLTRFVHFANFRHYYAFGNTPAEDFLRSVAADPAKPTRPTILSLGCGDIRSCMYTLWKNFGFEGKSVSGFAGVDFVLNDCSAAVLARNVLFLYLCLYMPKDGTSRAKKEWVASVWSIWYNHELTPEHDEVLTRALAQLLQWSGTAQEWAECRLGATVRFSSLDTFRAVKQMWTLWYSREVKFESVEAMKRVRQHHFQRRARVLHCSEDTSEMMQRVAARVLSPLRFHCDYSQNTIDVMVKECVAYAVDGSAFAENVLRIPHSTAGTTVNMTLFEQADGTYTLHCELVPYRAFHLAFIYSPVEVSRITGESEAVLPFLPVADKYFKKCPLLANSVQQFTMWLTATAEMMYSKQPEDCKVSFTFDCSDAISFSQTLFQFPKRYLHSLGPLGRLQFDVIYTSNLLDHYADVSAFILVTIALLKPGGALFTTSFHNSMISQEGASNDYVRSLFGFPPELLPVVLGIRCIGRDGQYSSTIAPQPTPQCANVLWPLHVTLVWKNITSQHITITNLTKETKLLNHLFSSLISTVIENFTFDSFLAIVHRFKATICVKPLTSYHFWEPLCKEITKEPILKPHLIQLQTQSLLHDLHMHITVTEVDCPLCTGQPLSEYIGGFTIHLNSSCEGFYEDQVFSVHLEYGSNNFAIITSLAGSSCGSNVELDFFFPKHYTKIVQRFAVYKSVYGRKITSENAIATGRVQDLRSCSLSKYFFMKCEKKPTLSLQQSSIGEVVKHNGDAKKCETTVSITDMCTAALEETALRAERSDVHRLRMWCGQSFHMTITYPYPIQSNVHIKHSKRNKSIFVAAERAITCSYNEDSIFYADPNNALALPQIPCGDKRLKLHFLLQTFPKNDPAEISKLKAVFVSLAENTSAEHTLFHIWSEKDPGICGVIIVHSIHFDPYFQSPLMYISFCLTHMLRKPSASDILSFLQLSHHVKEVSLKIGDEEYKNINKALTYLATVTRENPNIHEHVPPAMAKHKSWKHFQQALIYPLYPNAQTSLEEHGLTPNPFKVSDSSMASGRESSDTDVQQLCVNKCAYCGKKSANLKKCVGCRTVQYCEKECQTKHWNEHKIICKSSSNATASATFSCARCNKQTNLSRCSCQSVAYCSKECQKLDWPSHQDSCTSKQRASLNPAANPVADASYQNEQNPIGPELQEKKCEKCSNCNKIQRLKWCPCHKAAYCSMECRRLHWPLHKDVCTAIRK